MPDARRTTPMTVTYSTGEVLKFEVLEIPGMPEGTRVLNGGLDEAAWVIMSGMALGVAGNAAYDYLKFGLRNLRLCLASRGDEDKRLYFTRIAYLEVATRVPEGTQINVVGCELRDGKLVAAVAADGRRWRVEAGSTAREKPEVLVHVDPPELDA